VEVSKAKWELAKKDENIVDEREMLSNKWLMAILQHHESNDDLVAAASNIQGRKPKGVASESGGLLVQESPILVLTSAEASASDHNVTELVLLTVKVLRDIIKAHGKPTVDEYGQPLHPMKKSRNFIPGEPAISFPEMPPSSAKTPPSAALLPWQRSAI
jgi:hypothetical protein